MTPNIVFLDAFTCNPGDISFDELAGLGTFTAYDRTDLGQLESRAGNADIIIVNKFPINSQTLDKMPLVKYIVVAATGYNIIDIELVKEKKILVSNVKGYSTESVTQHVFA
ncbi:MAG TPA: D-2-hydroxyacid dehydrogenase, partial [Saprospiraceae bacterium]|nr:D-2-hydroxyacid dehydrogenase [Saprospiraceae bacterium]